MMLDRRGQMGGLAQFQGIVVTIMIIGVLVGATMLALGSFRDSLLPSTADLNCNTVNQTNCDSSYNATAQWVTAGSNLSSKAPTAGTLFGIGLIIVAVFGGIFFFMGRGGRI